MKGIHICYKCKFVTNNEDEFGKHMQEHYRKEDKEIK